MRRRRSDPRAITWGKIFLLAIVALIALGVMMVSAYAALALRLDPSCAPVTMATLDRTEGRCTTHAGTIVRTYDAMSTGRHSRRYYHVVIDENGAQFDMTVGGAPQSPVYRAATPGTPAVMLFLHGMAVEVVTDDGRLESDTSAPVVFLTSTAFFLLLSIGLIAAVIKRITFGRGTRSG